MIHHHYSQIAEDCLMFVEQRRTLTKTEFGTMEREFFDIEVNGVRVRVAVMRRDGQQTPIVCLHGFGSTKEDYADIARYPMFDGRPIIAFDAPGCGETECADLSALSIPFLQQTVESVLDRCGVQRFHLIGHSMGGLTALMYADDHRNAPLSFINIEGNVAPEDCFLSRQIIDYPSENSAEFMDSFVKRMWETPGFSNPLYATGLRAKVRSEAVGPIFRSMMELSDTNNLLGKFVQLPFAKMFVYGNENRELSYLATLQDHGVELAEIAHSGHFPMYSNPPALWTRISEFIERTEQVQ
jgi:pimeloyl-ACP methyl ester carboxylesterase